MNKPFEFPKRARKFDRLFINEISISNEMNYLTQHEFLTLNFTKQNQNFKDILTLFHQLL